MNNSKLWRSGVLAVSLIAAGCSSVPSGDSVEASTSREAEAPPTPATVTLDTGTPVKIRLNAALSTKSALAGQRFDGVLLEPLASGTTVVADRGAPVAGVVVASDEGGRVKGVATISVRLTQVNLANGRVADVSTNVIAREARQTKKKDAATVGIASGVGAAIGAIAGGGKGAAIGAGAGAAGGSGVVLATRGEAATIAAESPLTFTLQAPLQTTLN